MNAGNGPTAAAEDIRKDLQNLREDVMRLAGQVSALVSATGDKALGDVKQRIRQMGDTVSDIGGRSKDIATDLIEDVGATLEENMRKRPLATLAVAIGLGFVVVALVAALVHRRMPVANRVRGTNFALAHARRRAD
ncbi:MAG: hypothetical protein WB820_02480 [Rhodoplanes sp.]|jgi:ElaB/YqjD/DUF883 family membrane-anchored ribosome-binding protein